MAVGSADSWRPSVASPRQVSSDAARRLGFKAVNRVPAGEDVEVDRRSPVRRQGARPARAPARSRIRRGNSQSLRGLESTCGSYYFRVCRSRQARGTITAQTPENTVTEPCRTTYAADARTRRFAGVTRDASPSVVPTAPARQAGGHWFEPSIAHPAKRMVVRLLADLRVALHRWIRDDLSLGSCASCPATT
jgi:hypothetical protein